MTIAVAILIVAIVTALAGLGTFTINLVQFCRRRTDAIEPPVIDVTEAQSHGSPTMTASFSDEQQNQ